MTVQICRIRSKDAEYAAKEKELQQQYEEENERSTAVSYTHLAIEVFYHLRLPEDIAEVFYNRALNYIMQENFAEEIASMIKG